MFVYLFAFNYSVYISFNFKFITLLDIKSFLATIMATITINTDKLWDSKLTKIIGIAGQMILVKDQF